jgi:hypothetical protein
VWGGGVFFLAEYKAREHEEKTEEENNGYVVFK